MNARHIHALAKGNFKMEDLMVCRQMLRTLQSFWSRAGEVNPTSVSPARVGGPLNGARAGVEGLPSTFRNGEAALGDVTPRAA
jgi:hypothetical protein